MTTLELSIVMPCLNEARTLAVCIQKAQEFLIRANVQGEILVSDNGSSDGSQAIALAAGARVVHASERGYGAALIEGIQQARGRYIVMGDADESYDFSDLAPFLAELRMGKQLVMGNRFHGGIAEGSMPFLHQYLGNPVLSFLGRLFFRAAIGDFHCGLRGFSREHILKLGLVTSGMEFASEMVAKSALAGLIISEVPTTLRRDGRDRPPHLRTWRDGWRHLLFMLLFSPRWLFLLPGCALLATGLAGFVMLLFGHLALGGVTLGIHSLLYMAAATMLGFQLVQLAFLTKWIGVESGIVPPPRWLQTLAPWLRVETGLLIGLGLSLSGLLWSFQLVQRWEEIGYGALDPTRMMPMAIPAVTLMVVGAQAAAGALFAGSVHFSLRTSIRKVTHD